MELVICLNIKLHTRHEWTTVGNYPKIFQCPGVSARLASEFKHGRPCHSCGKRLVAAAIRAEDDYCDDC